MSFLLYLGMISRFLFTIFYAISLICHSQKSEKQWADEKRIQDSLYIVSLKHKSNFPFDSLAYIRVLEARQDSLYNAGQSIKAGRITQRITSARERLFKPGSTYTFHAKKGDHTTFYYSYEQPYISILQEGDLRFELYREKAWSQADHEPKDWYTTDNVIERYEDIKQGQEFIVKIRILPLTYTHTNSKGRKCTHNGYQPICKIISISAVTQ